MMAVKNQWLNKDIENLILPTIQNPGINNRINVLIPEGNVEEMLIFFMKSLFIPVKSTLIHAIKNGNLATWLSVNMDKVNKNYAKSEATAQGHLYQTLINVQ